MRMKMKTISIFIMLCILCLSIKSYAYDYESVDWTNLYVHSKNINRLEEKRTDLINWIWKSGTIDKEPSITTKSATTITNFGSISTNNISTTYDYYYSDNRVSATYHVYHIINSNPNNRLFIFNTGHGAGTETGSVTMVNALLNAGYDVIITYMLGKGDNTGYTDHFYYDHSEPINMINSTFQPMEMFFNHIFWTIEYIEDNYNYTDISNMGISGGGWTTILYSALDERITNTYSVAGTYPRFIYDEVMAGGGDWEQGSFSDYVYDFYTENVSYLDMYVLGATNGRLINIHNQYDSCCFAGTHSNFYKSYITSVSYQLAGSYNSYITTGTGHEITTSARNLILSTNEDIITEKVYPNFIKIDINSVTNNSTSSFRQKGLLYSSTNDIINWLNIIWSEV